MKDLPHVSFKENEDKPYVGIITIFSDKSIYNFWIHYILGSKMGDVPQERDPKR
jgi:hypothetical protein